MQFRIEPMERTDLIRVDPSASPVAAMIPELTLDTRDGSIDIIHLHECDNAVPASVYYGFVLRWKIPITADALRFAEAVNAGDMDALLTRVAEGADSEWDGNNHVCRLTDDAAAAVEEVGVWLTNWEGTLPESAGVYEAGDWFVDEESGVEGLTANTSDAELEALADSLEQAALADCVVLVGTLETLRRFRDRLRVYGIAEIAEALGVRRQAVALWHHRGQLPPPSQELAMGPIWTAETIEPWIAERRSSTT